MPGETPPTDPALEPHGQAGAVGDGSADDTGATSGDQRPRPVPSVWPTRLVALAATAAVLLLGLRVRLAARFPYVWFDEAFHALSSIEAGTLADLRQAVTWQYAPLLDYWLRWALWIPLLGSDEWALRIPSLVSSLSAIGLAAWLCYRHLWRSGHGRAYASAGAAVAALLLANHPLEIEIGAEVRHYALVSMLSVLWAGVSVLPARPRPALVALSSLLFLNAHFFSLPLVLTVGALLVGEQAVSRHRRALLTLSLGLAAAVAIFWFVNAPALHAMLGSPHGARAADLGAGNLLRVLGEARFIYERLLLQLDDGGIAIFGWAALSALGWWRTRSAGLRAAWLRIAGALLIALPLFLVMSRLRSGYPFSPRYGTPYTGLAFALLVVGLDAFPAVLRPLQQRLEKRSAMTAAALPLLALSVQIAIPLAELMARPAALRLDGQGGMRATFESIKALGRPTLVAASPCWAEMVPRYYWKYSGNRAAGVPFEVVRPSGRQGCLAGAMDEHNRGLFHRFLTRHPDGLILLYQQHAPCAVAPDRIQRRTAAVAAYQEWHPVVHGGNDLNACLWVIAHAEDEEEVRSIARQARFPPPINLAR